MRQKGLGQMSESRRLAVILAVSGGLMDAYTYLLRGKVFANAQTGNILLFGVNLSEGSFQEAFRYFFPVLAFALGIVTAELIRHFLLEKKSVHWRQWAVLAECVILFFVGLMPLTCNGLANAMVSFACGIQVESFRKVKGNVCATTMCIGNFRSGTQAVCDFLFSGERSSLLKGLAYYGIIAAFAFGAVVGNAAVKLLGQQAIWCSSLLLVLSFLVMFQKEEKK